MERPRAIKTEKSICDGSRAQNDHPGDPNFLILFGPKLRMVLMMQMDVLGAFGVDHVVGPKMTTQMIQIS